MYACQVTSDVSKHYMPHQREPTLQLEVVREISDIFQFITPQYPNASKTGCLERV
jgi:hypothetical protein